MIVDVIHPAAIIHVPPRARTRRLTYASVRTPVEIEAVPDGEMRHVRTLGLGLRGFGLYERDGTLWQRLSATTSMNGRADVTPEEWLAWLSGADGVNEWVAHQVEDALAMTPLAVYDRKGHSPNQGGMALGWRGEALAPERLGRPERDSRQDAAMAAARFVGEETLVTGSAVYLRYRPVANQDMSRAVIRPLLRLPPLNHPFLSPRHALDDLGKLNVTSYRQSQDAFRADLEALSPFVEDDVDLRLLANSLPGWFARSMDEHVKRLQTLDIPGIEVALEAKRQAAALAVDGDVGGLSGEAARAALETVLALAVRTFDIHPEWDLGMVRSAYDSEGALILSPGSTWAPLARHARKVLERNAPAPVPEDEEAMAGIGVSP